MMKTINMYTDGSCLGNPGPGGWACLLEFQGATKEFVGGDSHSTNNIMELTAIVEALKKIKEPCEINLYSDSKYCIDGMTTWIHGWIKRDWHKVKNVELWQEFIETSMNHTINANWVKAHNGHPQNERVDKLAYSEAQKFKKRKSK